jgi:hypothetical protein
MADNQELSKMKVGIKAIGQAVYGEATSKRIGEDIVFFHQLAKERNVDDLQSKRYARIVIILIAFYLESVSNLIFDNLVNVSLDTLDNRTDLPEPIRRLRAVYKQCSGNEMTLNTDGIRDIFTIRNRIIAHPAGRAQVQIAGDQLGRLDKHISFEKFKDFPVVYSRFTTEHADNLVKEVREFLTQFINLIATNISNEQLNYWLPTELS